MGKYEKGKIISGCVTGIEKYGIFISLDEYFSGLIHISEVSEGYVRNINDYVNIGDIIKVKIMDVDETHNQLKLSIKEIEYRENQKNHQRICETPNGFNPLKEQLNQWIEEKYQEIQEKK